MSGSAIVIIVGSGGGNRTQANYSTPYPVSAGDAIENTAVSGPNVAIAFTDNSMVTTDIYLGPGQKWTFSVGGAIVVQP